MADAPNTAPAFIQTVGLMGVGVSLTNQVCTPDNPGTTPVVAYDSTGDYAQGNGGLIEDVSIELTGTIVATTVCLYYKDLTETTPVWRKIGQTAIAAATYASTTELPRYSMRLKKVLFPVPSAGAATTSPPQQFEGLRVPSSGIQLGFALTVAVAAPIIITMWGGHY